MMPLFAAFASLREIFRIFGCGFAALGTQRLCGEIRLAALVALCRSRFRRVNRGDTPPDDRWRFLSVPARSPRTGAWRRDSGDESGNPRACRWETGLLRSESFPLD